MDKGSGSIKIVVNPNRSKPTIDLVDSQLPSPPKNTGGKSSIQGRGRRRGERNDGKNNVEPSVP